MFARGGELMSKSLTRVAKWDNAKAFLITLVVLGHAISAYIDESQLLSNVYLWLTVFHMPLFMFLTGLFSKSFVNAPKFNVNKIASYVLLFFFIKITIHLTLILCRGKGSFSFLTEKGTPWYIFVTAVFMAVTYLLKRFNGKKVLAASVLLALAVGYVSEIGDVLTLSKIFTFYPFFFLGYMLDRDKLLSLLNKKAVRLSSCAVLMLFTFVIFTFGEKLFSLRYVFSGNNPYSEFGGDWYPFGAFLRLGCYILSSAVGFAVLSVTPNKRIPLFTQIGSKTLTVYALHRQVLYVLQYTVMAPVVAALPDYGVALVIFAGSVVLAFLLSLKPFEYVLYPCTKCEKWLAPTVKWLKK